MKAVRMYAGKYILWHQVNQEWQGLLSVHGLRCMHTAATEVCGVHLYPSSSSAVTASSRAKAVIFTSCAPRPHTNLRGTLENLLASA
jgi:hypothetical protein